VNHPESLHQAAIARAFSKKVRPELGPEAAELVRIYDNTYGSASPGCCPEALAGVLDEIAEQLEAQNGGPCWPGRALRGRAALLRGEQP
jgi:hypothetical protein